MSQKPLTVEVVGETVVINGVAYPAGMFRYLAGAPAAKVFIHRVGGSVSFGRAEEPKAEKPRVNPFDRRYL